MLFGTPLGTQGATKTFPRRKRTNRPTRRTIFFGPFGRPWALQGRILVPNGFPKITQNRHEQSGPKRPPEEGFEMLQKMLPKRCPKIDVFGMPKPPKSVIRSFKIKVLEVPKSLKKTIKNEVPKGGPFHLFGALWRPLGGQGVTVRPLGVDLERVQKSVIF